jgi:hypothetical protein
MPREGFTFIYQVPMALPGMVMPIACGPPEFLFTSVGNDLSMGFGIARFGGSLVKTFFMPFAKLISNS